MHCPEISTKSTTTTWLGRDSTRHCNHENEPSRGGENSWRCILYDLTPTGQVFDCLPLAFGYKFNHVKSRFLFVCAKGKWTGTCNTVSTPFEIAFFYTFPARVHICKFFSLFSVLLSLQNERTITTNPEIRYSLTKRFNKPIAVHTPSSSSVTRSIVTNVKGSTQTSSFTASYTDKVR